VDCTADWGGGFFSGSSPLKIRFNRIERNNAEFGGAICCFGEGSKGIIEKNIINDNESKEFGGGIFVYEDASPEIIKNTIINNFCKDLGGGISCFNTLFEVVIKENTIVNNSTNLLGGGIFSNGAVSIITENIIESNKASSGAGVSVGCLGTLQNNYIAKNIASSSGGGVYCDTHESVVMDNHITLNQADDGGGIGVGYYSSATIIGNLIDLNIATDSGGGIIGGGSLSCRIELDNNIILENTSNKRGGGVCCGGVYFDSKMNGNFIAKNVSELGGGLYLITSDLVFTNNTVMENHSLSNGGGLYLRISRDKIINNTIVNNTAAGAGGGIFGTDSNETPIINSILWNNTAPLGPEIALEKGTFKQEMSISYSNVKGGQGSVSVGSGCTLNWGLGMIDADPLFVDLEGGDWHLTFPSPCRGSGDSSASDLSEFDFEGDSRIYQGSVDIGADEFCPHLYIVGDTTPGGSIEGRLVGLPGLSPNGLFISTGVLETAMPTIWGNFWLESPWLMVPLPTIPSNGILLLPATIPASPAAPYDLALQGLVGLYPDSLTNMEMLKVR